jgi:uncharacterized protein YkwD
MLVRTATLRAPAGAVLAALALAFPAQGAQCDALADAAAVVCEINGVRAERGYGELVVDRRLRRTATLHARDMVGRGYFSHVTPEGLKLSARLRNAGYITGHVAWRVGETLAWGRARLATAAATVTAWMRSASHRRVLLGPYREIGVGVVAGDPLGGSGTTYTAEFGRLGD